MKAGKWLRLLLGASLAILFLWLMIRQVRFNDVKRAFVGVDEVWITAAVMAFSVGYACRIERWRAMLERDSPDLKWIACAGPLLASFAANNVLPFRAGDLLRSVAFNRQLGASYGVTVATLFVERLLDLLMVLLLFGAALVFFDMDSAGVAGVGGGAVIASVAVILIVLLQPRYVAPLASALGGISARLFPRLGRRLSDEIDRCLGMLQHLADGKTMPKLVLWSLLVWAAEGCVFWFAALALPTVSAPLAGWVALPVGTLATLIPSTPGYIGTFDYFTAHAMTEFGNPRGAAAAYTLLVHALLWFPSTVAGGVYLLLHPVRQPKSLRAIRS